MEEQLAVAGPSNLVKPFEVYNRALQREIQQLVQRFEYRRTVEHAVERLPRAELGLIVDEMLERLPAWDTASENLRMAREKALERAVVNLPSLVNAPWVDDEAHLLIYHDVLDVLLVCDERQLLEASMVSMAIEAMLEVQSVQNAEYLFGYLESRRADLTRGMVPARGKALVLLRLLNELLRRLSKSTRTVFCGRILLFLGNIFPLGERSGVNLRGEFNKENVTTFEVDDSSMAAREETSELEPSEAEGKGSGEAKMEQDAPESAAKDEPEKPLADPRKHKISIEGPEDGEEVEEARGSGAKNQGMNVDVNVDAKATKAAEAADSKLVPPVQRADASRGPKEPEFYLLFWSMQRYFSDPPSLFAQTVGSGLPSALSDYAATFPSVPPLSKDGTVSTAVTAAATPNLTLLRQGVQKMLDVFAEASKKEKALQGAAKDGISKSSTRRPAAGNADSVPASATSVSSSAANDVRKMFFYPKFLTSKTLLDLEVADSSFRKQVLVQCLILFQYLHSFTEAARLKLNISLTQANRTLQLPYRLSEADNKWVSDLEARTYTEISRTPPDGEYFVKTVRLVLQGERNWTFWKANSCQQMEQPALDDSASEAARTSKKKLEQPAPGFPYKAGTAALSRLWVNEQKKPEDLVKPTRTLDECTEAYKKQDDLVQGKIMDLELENMSPAQRALDPELQQLNERKASIAWRSLRIASASQLHLFARIGYSDIGKLSEEIQKAATAPSQASRKTTPGAAKEEDAGTEMATPASVEAAAGDEPATKTMTAESADHEAPAADVQAKRPRADSGMDIDEHAKKPKVE